MPDLIFARLLFAVGHSALTTVLTAGFGLMGSRVHLASWRKGKTDEQRPLLEDDDDRVASDHGSETNASQ